jgi:hypothetical protein
MTRHRFQMAAPLPGETGSDITQAEVGESGTDILGTLGIILHLPPAVPPEALFEILGAIDSVYALGREDASAPEPPAKGLPEAVPGVPPFTAADALGEAMGAMGGWIDGPTEPDREGRHPQRRIRVHESGDNYLIIYAEDAYTHHGEPDRYFRIDVKAREITPPGDRHA